MQQIRELGVKVMQARARQMLALRKVAALRSEERAREEMETVFAAAPEATLGQLIGNSPVNCGKRASLASACSTASGFSTDSYDSDSDRADSPTTSSRWPLDRVRLPDPPGWRAAEGHAQGRVCRLDPPAAVASAPCAPWLPVACGVS